MKRNKLLTGAVSIVCAGAMLVAGAFAIQGSHNIVNQFFARTEIPPIDNPFEPFIEEEFDPADGTKEVKVSNPGDTIFYARLSLHEFMLLGNDVPATKPAENTAHPYVDYMPDLNDLNSTTAFSDYFKMVFGADVITQQEFNNMRSNGDPVEGVWIYSSSDGYAYWSDPIQPGDSTELFLERVDIDPALDHYYYALDVRMEYVDKDDLWLWATTDARAASDQVAPVSPAVRAHFAGWVTADPEVIPTSLIRVSGLKPSNQWNVGDAVVPTMVEIAPNPAHPANPGNAGDTPVYTVVPAGSYTVIPTVIAAETEYIAIIVPTPTGKIGWYLPLGSSTPANPDTVTLNDGTKFTQVDSTGVSVNSRIYEKLDASGNGTGAYVYYQGVNAADFTDGATIPASEMLDVIYHDTPAIYVPASAPDPAYTVTTNYLIDWDGGWTYIPVYPQGVNYWQAFVAGTDPALGNGDERATSIATSDQVPFAQRSNW